MALVLAWMGGTGCFQSQAVEEYLEDCRRERLGESLGVRCEVGRAEREIVLGAELTGGALAGWAGASLRHDPGVFRNNQVLRFAPAEILSGDPAHQPPNGYADLGCPALSISLEGGAPTADLPVELTATTAGCAGIQEDCGVDPCPLRREWLGLGSTDCGRIDFFRWDTALQRWTAAERFSASEGTAACGDYRLTVLVPPPTEAEAIYRLFIRPPDDFAEADALTLEVSSEVRPADPTESLQCQAGLPVRLMTFFEDLEGKFEGEVAGRYPLDPRSFRLETLDAEGHPIPAGDLSMEAVVPDGDGHWTSPPGQPLAIGSPNRRRLVVRNVWGGEAVWPPGDGCRLDVERRSVPIVSREQWGESPVDPDALAIELTAARFPDRSRLETDRTPWTFYVDGSETPEDPEGARARLAFELGAAFPFVDAARLILHPENESQTACEFDASGPRAGHCNTSAPPAESMAYDPATGTLAVQAVLWTDNHAPRNYRYQLRLRDSFQSWDFPPENPSTIQARTPVFSSPDRGHQDTQGSVVESPLYFYYDPEFFASGTEPWLGSLSFSLRGWDDPGDPFFCPDPTDAFEFDSDLRDYLNNWLASPNPPMDCRTPMRFRITMDADVLEAGRPIRLGVLRLRPGASNGQIEVRVTDITHLPQQPPLDIESMPLRPGVISSRLPGDNTPPQITPPVRLCLDTAPDIDPIPDGDCVWVADSKPRVCFGIADAPPSSGLRDAQLLLEGGAVGLPVNLAGLGVSEFAFDDCDAPNPPSGGCFEVELLPEEQEPQHVDYEVYDRNGNLAQSDGVPAWLNLCLLPLGLDPDLEAMPQEFFPDACRAQPDDPCVLERDQAIFCHAPTRPGVLESPTFYYRLYAVGEAGDTLMDQTQSSQPCYDTRTRPLGGLSCLSPGTYRLQAWVEGTVAGGAHLASTFRTWTFIVPPLPPLHPWLAGPPPVFTLDLQDFDQLCRLTEPILGQCPSESGAIGLAFEFQSELGRDHPDATFEAEWAFDGGAFMPLALQGARALLDLQPIGGALYGLYDLRVRADRASIACEGTPPEVSFRFELAPPEGSLNDDVLVPQTRILRMPASPIRLAGSGDSARISFGYDGPQQSSEIAYQWRLVRPDETVETRGGADDWSPLQVAPYQEITFCRSGLYLFQVRAVNLTGGLPLELRADPSPPTALIEVVLDDGADVCTEEAP